MSTTHIVMNIWLSRASCSVCVGKQLMELLEVQITPFTAHLATIYKGKMWPKNWNALKVLLDKGAALVSWNW